MAQSLVICILLALFTSSFALPKPSHNKDFSSKRVKRDNGNQYLDAVDVTSQPSLRAPGMIDDLLISDGLRDSESNVMEDGSYEQQQEDTDIGDLVASLPLASDDGEDDDVDLTLYPQGWNDQTDDEIYDGQVYDRRKRNVAATLNLANQHFHAKNKHSSRAARKRLENARHPAQAPAKKNRTKRGVSQRNQQTLSDEDLLNLILLADEMQARKQQKYRDQYGHQRRPLISEEDPLLAAALLAAQAEDEENLYDGYQQDEDDDLYAPLAHTRGRVPMYSSKVYPDQYSGMEYTDNAYRRSGYRQPYLAAQKRSSRNLDNDKLYAIAQMLGKPHTEKHYRRQRT
ncbi:uncharacterized protein LOC136042857 [Artemia franciscana]|uniref:Uncharacterized protein n=1 Tax=Artemia franciscana TaxID=6661 RepID=A0AA88L701_ARTSF|nr:hypothetical protein QYM36_009833 [Artemia franciscana]